MKFTKEFLINEYVKLRKTQEQISKENDCSQHLVSYWLQKFDIPRRTASEHADITGQKFHRLTAIEYVRLDNDCKKGVWICKCDCGNTTRVRRMALIRGTVKSCGCLKKEMVGNNSHAWHGSKVVSATFFSKARSQAKRRGIFFDVTLEDLDRILHQQYGKCVFTGILLDFNNKTCNASLDRIDSNKSYTSDNIQFVYKRVNSMKNNMKDNEFIELCSIIHNYRNNNGT